MISPKRNHAIAFPYAKNQYNKKYDSGNSYFAVFFKKRDIKDKLIHVANLECTDEQKIMCP